MPAFEIRPALPHEASFLTMLALRSKAYWGYSAEFMAACREELTYSAADFQHIDFFVADRAGALLGFYALARHSPTQVELEALFVEPDHIGQGIGRALIEHAKTTAGAKGAKTMIIQGDPHAKRFYLAAGGELTGETESGSIPGRYLPTFSIRLAAKNSGQ
ncbi:MAG: GNAT family N-acetyltransferase [Anaerolineae bacterium]|nr:GNAT family N-acetyltransferase [Anaerolineae bacterium]